MDHDSTSAAVQRFLDALAADTPPEPIVRELLERAVRRLQLLSGALLHRSYPRLTQPPLNLSTDELLGGVVAGVHAQPEELERFRREAQAAAGLCRANVVQIHNVGDVDGRPYFTMEFVEGGNLADHIQGVPQPARPAAALVATLAEAVQAAHESGIVHRDLKPSNILLAEDGTPKVTDFGLARRLEGGGGTDAQRRPVGDAELHGPRAGGGPPGRHGAGDGRVRARGDPVRVAAGSAALPGGVRGGDRAAGGTRGACRAHAVEPPGAARPGNDLPEIFAQGAAAPQRDGRRPRPLPPARAG